MNFRPRLAGAAVIFSRHVPLISMTVAWYMQPGGIVRESLGERVSRVHTRVSNYGLSLLQKAIGGEVKVQPTLQTV